MNETLYSAVNVSAVVQRRTSTFLLKSLLPLVLLILVVYVTLFFPASLLSQRLSVAISALLAGAVLLNAINNQLVDVGYTTAIEYGFYVFFGLCLFCTIATLIAERLKADKHLRASLLFEWFARAAYPAVVVGTLAWYVLRYSSRLV